MVTGGVITPGNYTFCFSSVEDAAERPSEDEPQPSAVDLATSPVANWRSGPTWVTWISTLWRFARVVLPSALHELAGDEDPHALLE